MLRRKRNLSDHTGEEIDESLVDSCSSEAEQLLEARLRQACPALQTDGRDLTLYESSTEPHRA